MELFRAYSDSSQGCNSKDLFAPGAAVSCGNTTTYTPPSLDSVDFAQELTDALAWKKSKPSILVFFSASLLFTTDLARYRKQRGEDNVKITCFDSRTARTPTGNPVRFWSVASLLEQHGITLSNKDGSIRDYADVSVAIECTVPGEDALTATFDDMEQAGLYSLYPAMASGYRSHRPRLALTTQDLRDFHFQEEKSLTTGHINVAAKVAATFQTDSAEGTVQVPSNVLVHVLALRKRHAGDVVLAGWLQNCSTEVIDLADDDNRLPITDFLRGPLEVEQCRELRSIVSRRQIDAAAINHNISVSKIAQEQELAQWQKWRREHIDEMREARERRPDYVPKRGSRKRSRQERESSQESDHLQQEPHSRSKPNRLPRAEYRAQKDAARASRTEVRKCSFSGKGHHDQGFETPGFETKLFNKRAQRDQDHRKSKTRPHKNASWW